MTTTPITVKFFARLRETLDTDQLTIDHEPGLTAGHILTQLAKKGGAWTELEGTRPVLIAVNQTLAKPDTELQSGDEVAFFPPVTGG